MRMKMTENVHEQFARYFEQHALEPYLYLLSKKLSEGHICIEPEEWEGKDVDELYVPEPLPRNHPFISDGSKKSPLVYDNGKLYLERYFAYETLLLEKIREIIRGEAVSLPRQLKILEARKDLIKRLFPHLDNTIDRQLTAVAFAFLHHFLIITGGPGTGKTTTVAKILYLLLDTNPDLKVALAAPTGKAAARMAESLRHAAGSNASFESLETRFLGFEPATIHRLLGYVKDSIYFKHNASNPLPYDVIIIDESSMIDIALFAKLMDAIPPKATVILLGDRNQLASVEAGSIFGELGSAASPANRFSATTGELLQKLMPQAQEDVQQHVATANNLLFEHVVELDKSYRFSATQGIGKLSKAILDQNQEALVSFFSEPEEEVTLDTSYSQTRFEEFAEGYADFIRENDISKALKKLGDLRILCATREGEWGVYEANRAVEKYLQHKKLIEIKGEFYENRPVMVTRNIYSLELFNGDIGLMRRDENGQMRVWFEVKGQAVGIHPANIPAMETVFAMTIHKSQGSEFDRVLIRLPNEDMELLTAELIYTAITRARKKVIIQTNAETFLSGCKKRVNRSSGIRERLLSM